MRLHLLAVVGLLASVSSVRQPASEQPLWVMDFELGVRPMAFETNADGSTKRMFVQLTEFNGFAVIDFATHKEVRRIELPKLRASLIRWTWRRKRSTKRQLLA